MTRGNNRGRGGFRGGSPRGDNFRGRGRGGGRGFTPRGRGRGGGGGGSLPDYMDDFDFPIVNEFENGSSSNTPGRGNWTPRGRARGYPFSRPGTGTPIPMRVPVPRRGRGGYRTLDEINNTAPEGSPRGRGRGRGDASPYDRGGRGRRRPGRGSLDSGQKAGVPLSRLLREDRPLLRPIIFVRSVHTATLFKEQEDILQPVVESAGDDEKSHVPTADRIAEIFNSNHADLSSEEEDEGRLEEIDFADVGQVQAEVDTLAAALPQASQSDLSMVEEKFTGFYIDTTQSKANTEAHTSRVESTITVGSFLGQPALGAQDDEEVIVYVAPHPRSGVQTPASKSTSLPSAVEPVPTTSILTGLTVPSVLLPSRESGVVSEARNNLAVDGTPALAAADVSMETVTAVEPLSSMEEDTVTVKIPSPPPQASERAQMEVSAIQVSVSVEEATDQNIGVEAMQEAQPTAEVRASTAPPPEDLPAPRFADTKATELQAAASTTTVPAPPSASVAVSDLTFSSLGRPGRKQSRRLHPVGGPRSLLKRSRKARRRSARAFGAFGAMRDEELLHDRDAREHERRYDSNVYWGTDDEHDGKEDVDQVDEVSEGLGAMDLDGDKLHLKAMRGFLKSMGVAGQAFVTMDDVGDMKRLRREDEEGPEGTAGESGSEHTENDSENNDDEVEKVVMQEEMFIAEANEGGQENLQVEAGTDEDDDESDDEEETPRRNFLARLQKMRQNAKGKGKANVEHPLELEEEEENFDIERFTWEEDEDDVLAGIEEILKQNAHILQGRDRKKKKTLFRAIQNGEFDDYFDDVDDFDDLEDMMQPAFKRKDRGPSLPLELREQWERDRQKKAENKAKRRQAMLEAAADPLAQHKGGKKGRKAMLAAMRLVDDDGISDRIVDLVSLDQQIRRFVADIGGRSTMALPPCDKQTRKKVHEMAEAYGLKSQSKGHGNARYTTLIKTSRTGLHIKHKKIQKLLKTAGAFDGSGRAMRRPPASLEKHREGEEVGKAAPKIAESNIGFKMLAAMGWSEGNMIGMSGGLEAPLTAIMKKTKLGLGATASLRSK